jgi:hypothetical protein
MERIENPDAQDAEQSEGAEVVRLWPISVLLVSPDRCWRSTVTMLIGRRDRPALSAEDEREAVEIATSERVDVVVVERPGSESPRSWDAYIQGLVASIGLAMAQQGARVAPVGVVVVSEPPRQEGSRQSLELDKWGPFGELFGAIARADRARRLPRERRFLPWPASLRAARAD